MTVLSFEDRSAWLMNRAKYVGASEVPALFGKGYSGQTPLSIYLSKVDPNRNLIQNPSRRMRAGTHNEPFVRELFADETGWHVQYDNNASCIHPNKSLAWSPDGIVWDTEAKNTPLEIKVVSDAATARQWHQGPPDRVFLQCQTAMACCGAPHAFAFAVLQGDWDNPVLHKIDRHPEWIAAIEARAIDFMACVDMRIQPQPEADDGDNIKAMFPLPTSGKSVDIPEDIVERLEAAKAVLKEAEDAKKELENAVKCLIGDAETATAGKYVLTYKSTSRKEYIVEATTFRQLRIKEQG